MQKRSIETIAPGIDMAFQIAATKTGDALTAGKNTAKQLRRRKRGAAVLDQLDANHDGNSMNIEDIIILGLRTPG